MAGRQYRRSQSGAALQLAEFGAECTPTETSLACTNLPNAPENSECNPPGADNPVKQCRSHQSCIYVHIPYGWGKKSMSQAEYAKWKGARVKSCICRLRSSTLSVLTLLLRQNRFLFESLRANVPSRTEL